jgi:hypothetical protein
MPAAEIVIHLRCRRCDNIPIAFSLKIFIFNWYQIGVCDRLWLKENKLATRLNNIPILPKGGYYETQNFNLHFFNLVGTILADW